MQLFKSGYWLNLVGPASIVKRRGLVKFLGFNLVAPVRVNPPTRCLSERRLHRTSGTSWVPAPATKLRRSLRPTTTAGLRPKPPNCMGPRPTPTTGSNPPKPLPARPEDRHNSQME